MRLRLATLALVAWYIVIAAVVLPRPFVWHPHWYKVAWIPFVSPPANVTDSILNVILFLPAGILSAVCRLPIRWSLLIGASVALLGETAQIFSHDRIPSFTDVTCNVIGVAAGVLAMKAFVTFNSTRG